MGEVPLYVVNLFSLFLLTFSPCGDRYMWGVVSFRPVRVLVFGGQKDEDDDDPW